MRTNIVLDDALVNEARELTGIRTKKELVHEGLRALVAAQKRTRLSALHGRIRFAPGYDPKATREGR